jgi:hypothetical protein
MFGFYTSYGVRVRESVIDIYYPLWHTTISIDSIRKIILQFESIRIVCHNGHYTIGNELFVRESRESFCSGPKVAAGRLSGDKAPLPSHLRSAFKNWATGEMLVPEDALPFLADKRIPFSIEGSAD